MGQTGTGTRAQQALCRLCGFCWDRATTIPACPHTSRVTAPMFVTGVSRWHRGLPREQGKPTVPREDGVTPHHCTVTPWLSHGHREPGAGGTGEGVNGGGGGGGGDRRHGRPSPRAAEGADRRQRLTSPARGEAAPVAADNPPIPTGQDAAPAPPTPGAHTGPRDTGAGDAEPALIAARCCPGCAKESDKSALGGLRSPRFSRCRQLLPRCVRGTAWHGARHSRGFGGHG